MGIALWVPAKPRKTVDKHQPSGSRERRTASILGQTVHQANAAVNVVIGVLLGVAINGLARLMFSGAWLAMIKRRAARGDRPPRVHVEATTNSGPSDTTTPPGCSRVMAKAAVLTTSSLASMGEIPSALPCQVVHHDAVDRVDGALRRVGGYTGISRNYRDNQSTSADLNRSRKIESTNSKAPTSQLLSRSTPR
jgi:hypothetical protein